MGAGELQEKLDALRGGSRLFGKDSGLKSPVTRPSQSAKNSKFCGGKNQFFFGPSQTRF
jgi:hypothetical protein